MMAEQYRTMYERIAEDVMPRMVELDDGTYPWMQVRKYVKASTADQAAYRIRGSWKKDGMRLPDIDGGDEGVWTARVERIVRGVRGRWGPGVLWVQYIGRRSDVEERMGG